MRRDREGYRVAHRESQIPKFSSRELGYLQCLVDGLRSTDEIGKRLGGISEANVFSIRNQVRKRYSLNSDIGNQVHRAIADLIIAGFLDTSALPGKPKEELIPEEIKLLSLMTLGRTPEQIRKIMNIPSHWQSYLQESVISKLNVFNHYQAVAWAAREMVIELLNDNEQ